jgi:hypothetical protein
MSRTMVAFIRGETVNNFAMQSMFRRTLAVKHQRQIADDRGRSETEVLDFVGVPPSGGLHSGLRHKTA